MFRIKYMIPAKNKIYTNSNVLQNTNHLFTIKTITVCLQSHVMCFGLYFSKISIGSHPSITYCTRTQHITSRDPPKKH